MSQHTIMKRTILSWAAEYIGRTRVNEIIHPSMLYKYLCKVCSFDIVGGGELRASRDDVWKGWKIPDNNFDEPQAQHRENDHRWSALTISLPAVHNVYKRICGRLAVHNDFLINNPCGQWWRICNMHFCMVCLLPVVTWHSGYFTLSQPCFPP